MIMMYNDDYIELDYVLCVLLQLIIIVLIKLLWLNIKNLGQYLNDHLQ
jgi:hypothetical protein